MRKLVLLGVSLATLGGGMAAPAKAYTLDLVYSGLTFISDINGTPIPDGTPFTLDATFDTAISGMIAPGEVEYLVSAVTATVGGVTYTETMPGNDFVLLVDSTNTSIPGVYLPALVTFGMGEAFIPGYQTATPPLDATAPTPTVFSNYLGSLGITASITTASGVLDLAYDPTIGVSAEILPEPSGLAILGFALAGMATARRRKAC